MSLESRIDNIVKILDEKKGNNIESFNLEDSDYIAKSVILVNSLGGKHTSALYDNLRVAFRESGEKILGADESDDWIVVDLGDILIHIMTPEYRLRYKLEKFLKELKEGKLQESKEA